MRKLISIVLCLAVLFSTLTGLTVFAQTQTVSNETSYTNETFLDRVRSDFDLVWSDEFNGDTLDTTKWQFDGQLTRRNSEIQIYADSMEDGNLQFDGQSAVIVPKIESRVSLDGRKYKYTSAEISTQGKQSWKYGYFEVRAKASIGKNVVPAIWTMGYDYPSGTCDWPYSGEIDIIEGDSSKSVYSTLHHANAYGSKYHVATGAGNQKFEHNLNEEFHNYWLFWTDKYLIIGVDDNMHQIVDITKPELAQSFRTFEHWLILNVAMGLFASPVDDSQEDEWKMYIDYVRVYQLNKDEDYDKYIALSAKELIHNGYELYENIYPTNSNRALNLAIEKGKLSPGKYDVYAEVGNNSNGTETFINGQKIYDIAYVDHGKEVGNQAYIGSIDLQEDCSLDFTFKGKNNSSTSVKKLLFVKTNETKTNPIVANKNSCFQVSDYIEVSTEDELLEATKHIKENGTIKLLQDITLTKNAFTCNTCTIDLNDKTLTVNGGYFSIGEGKKPNIIKNGNVVVPNGASGLTSTKENNYNVRIVFEDVNFDINTSNNGQLINHSYSHVYSEFNGCTFVCGSNMSASSTYKITKNDAVYNNCIFNMNGTKLLWASNNSKVHLNSCVVNDAQYLVCSDSALTNGNIVLNNTTINNLSALSNFADNTAYISVADNSVLKQSGEAVSISANMTGNFTMECNHSFVDATCLLPKHCEYCFKEEGVALEHNIVTETTPADCLYAGSVKTYCDKCSTVFSEKVLPVTEHNYKLVETFEPTCKMAGYHLWACENCGMQQQRSYNGDGAVIKLPHNPDVSRTTVKAPTCTMGGYTQNYCLDCGSAYKTNFKWSIDHDYESIYNEDEGSVTYTCKDCGESYVDACIHQATEGKDEVVAPTCTKQGYTQHLCSVCGKTYKDTYVDATGVHIPNEQTKQVIDPTCTEKGYTAYTCKNCTTQIKQEYVDALGHIEVVDKGYAPTCTEKGLTDGKHCDRDGCKVVLVKQQEIEALGHKEVVTIKGVEPTCTLSGLLDEIECETCGITLQERAFVPAKGHEYKELVTKEPTCGKAGVKTYKCECGHSYTESIPKTNAHSYKWVVTKKATYFAKGTKSYKCSCGKVAKTSTIKKLVLKKPTVKYTAGKKKIAIKYTKVSGAKGFQVRYRLTTSKKWKTLTFKTSKSATKYIKNLKKNKKYYLQSRAYTTSKGKKLYSNWTARKTIKVK